MADTWRTRLRWWGSGVGRALRRPAHTVRLVMAEPPPPTPSTVLEDLLTAEPPPPGAPAARENFARVMHSAGVREVCFDSDGLTWRTDLGDEIGISLFSTGGYETASIEAVVRWLQPRRPTGVVVDAGANIGTTTIPFAQAGYAVVAIEPVPSTFALLAANVTANGFAERVTLVGSAVAEHEGRLDMWTGFGSGQGEVAVEGRPPAATRWGTAGELVTVAAAPLHRILAEHSIAVGDVALVWSDVQGAETSVIRSGADLWRSGVPLYLEVDPASLELHAGLAAFTACVSEHFATFIPSDGLEAGEQPQHIDEFARWVATIDDYSDALLIPA